MIAIGLSGKAQVGKDCIAQMLVTNYGFTRYAFADALKQCALVVDPYVMIERTLIKSTVPPGKTYYMRLSDVVNGMGWDEAKKHDDVRRLLQRMGTEMGREIISPTLWIDIAINKVLIDKPLRVVFSDMRFQNESEEFKDRLRAAGYKCFTVRIIRSEASEVVAHKSEELGFPADFVLENKGTLQDLESNLATLMNSILRMEKV